MAAVCVARASPDAVVGFNEIHYNPVGPSEDGEWIELFNQMGINTDVSGWRIDGVGYTFPLGTVIPPGGYLVVARTPGPGQLGPFPGHLENGGERLRLINQGDRLMDELTYGDDGRWPEAADGSGVTLAKRRPYSANKPPENWTAAAQVGGTPGAPNFPGAGAGAQVLISEMPPAGEDPFWIELVNAGPAGVELGGMVLTAGADPLRRHVIPPRVLAAGGLLVLTEAELGFRPVDGEKLFLYDVTESAVLDARELTGSLRGRSEAHGGDYLYPDAATPGTPNSFSFHDEVVISEIMYNPPALPAAGGCPAPVESSDNQWIEIANRSAGPIALDGWEFNDGVSFVFPAGVSLAAGEHACIARDELAFANAYPGARLLGEFDGGLSRSSERIHLRDHNKNPVDEVRYHDSGRWPDAADGGGASLELRDLDADNSVAESWAASDETAQSGWRDYTYGGTVTASSGPDSKWSEFNMGLLGAGEILIDNIRIVENGSTQKISFATFGRGSSAWRFRGTHRHSEIIVDPDNPGNKVLRLVARGPTDHMHNQIETTLLSPANNNQSCEISFSARWVSGSNQLHTRLYFNRLPKVTIIDRPAHVGTPSAPNSRAEANIGPSITETIHAPGVPGAGEAVTVTARVADPDNVSAMQLFHSVNGGGFQTTPMGAGADGVSQGTIPGQPAAAVVQFYIEAIDGLGATSTFPAAGPDSRALYKVDDGLAATNGQHNFRIVVTNAERDFIHEPIEVMSNDRIGATIIDREEDIYYDVKLRLKGSERARNQANRVGYNMRFGRDNLYRGIHESLAIDRSEGQVPGQFEILFDLMMANSGGVVSRYYDFIKVVAPKNQHTRSAVLQMARYDDVFLDSQFENGSKGNLYEYELLYTPNNDDDPIGNEGYKLPEPDGVTSTSISDKGDDKENYRWFFLKKNNRELDDFAPIIAYNKRFSLSGPAFERGLEDVVDVDGWLRGMAYAVLSGAGDNAGAGSAHNGMYYAHPDGRVMFLPHDMDFQFDTSRSIFANPECAKLTADPARKRIYLGHLNDIISTTYNGRRMSTWTRHLATFDPGQDWAGHLSYISSRSDNVLAQITGQIPSVPFAISGTSPMSVSFSPAIVSGDGWVDVREIRLAGSSVPLALTWTDGDSWRVVLPVSPGEQVYTLEALNFSGAVIGSDSITVDNSNVAELASAGNLVISELMYHPADPTQDELALGYDDADLFEFVELTNVSSVGVDLTGVRFSSGITFALASEVIPPGGRMVLARNRSAFLSRHPGAAGILLAGEYGIGDTNQFSNGGEQVALIDYSGADIVRFTYGGGVPWSAAADGEGPSLVLISPESKPDATVAGAWRSSASVGGNPGTSDAVAFSGDPNGDANNNGVPDLIDHALADGGQLSFTMSPDVATLEFLLNLAADDVVVGIEISTDAQTWDDGSSLFSSMDLQYLGEGRQRVRHHADRAALPDDKLFVRLRATLVKSTFSLTIARTASGFDLTWASRSGMRYRLKSTSDPSVHPSTWTLVKGDIVASPPANTESVSPAEATLFYIVEESPAP